MEFDLDVFLGKGLTPDAYFFCKMRIEQKYGSMFVFLSLLKNPQGLFDLLIEKKLLLSTQEYEKKKKPQDLIFNMKNLNLMFSENETDSLFWEIFSMYPIKVPSRDGGSRPLRAADVAAQDTIYCKNKYNQIIKGSKVKHERIKMCLQAELWNRKRSNSYQFMQEFKTWIRNQAWEKYAYLIEEVQELKMNRESGDEKYAENEF